MEPFDEPSAGWWKNDGGQEGCGFKSGQGRMIKELGKALVARGLYRATSVGAADEASIALAVSTLKGYDDSAFSFLSQIKAHSYSGWNARGQIDSAARARRKNQGQSESGPLGKGSDPIDIAMWMSHVIIQDLRKKRANAWVGWQFNDPGANWSSIDVDHARQTFGYRGRCYMHAAFSRLIRPGDRIDQARGIAAAPEAEADLAIADVRAAIRCAFANPMQSGAVGSSFSSGRAAFSFRILSWPLEAHSVVAGAPYDPGGLGPYRAGSIAH